MNSKIKTLTSTKFHYPIFIYFINDEPIHSIFFSEPITVNEDELWLDFANLSCVIVILC